MLAFAGGLRGRGTGLRGLNLGGGDVDTATPMGSMVFTVMAALAQMERQPRGSVRTVQTWQTVRKATPG